MGLAKWKAAAQKLQQEVYVLALASRDPRTPWYAKLFVGGIVAYVLSPIDPIPDFIPVLGYVDELILVPFLIVTAMRMIPSAVLVDSRKKAEAHPFHLRKNWKGALIVLCVWIVAVALLYMLVRALWR